MAMQLPLNGLEDPSPSQPGRVLAYSMGFSNRSWDDFLEILRSFRIERIVDIRTLPGSRRTPQYNKEHLEGSLPGLGVEYIHLKTLGGLRRANPADLTNAGWRNASFRGYADYMQGEEFWTALSDLIRLSGEKRTVFACTEAGFWRCHRSLVSDALLVRGYRVEHIFHAKKSEPHRLTPFARIEGLRITYP